MRHAQTWIDHPNYFGPDRRRARFPFRMIERRVDNAWAGPPPPLSTALRQLRQHILEARGGTREAFITRVESTALLARMNQEPEVSERLLRLAAVASIERDGDVGPDLIDMLNRAHEALRSPPPPGPATSR